MNRFNTYEEGLDFLFGQLPIFSRIGQDAIRPGLDNIKILCDHLGNPQHRFRSIHIAGSNGKGSTSHILAATLQACGYKTGLYTSPHLTDIRERFRINGQLIDKQYVLDFLNSHIDCIEAVKPSYFELNVAMAFDFFAREAVDFAVIETGLGGRLDSTNIIHPVLSVITNISLEHTALLGDTLQKIAFEKAGIIKPGVPVVIGETQEATEQVFFLQAHHNNSSITFADARWDMVKTGEDSGFQYFKLVDKGALQLYDAHTDLKGSYQARNIVTAAAAVQVLHESFPDITIAALIRALPAVKAATGLRGRWEKISERPEIIIDVAHNPAGMEFLQANVGNASGKTLHFIIGFADDKDVGAVLPYFPKLAKYYFTQASVPRAMPASVLAQKAAGILSGNAYTTVGAAIAACLEQAGAEDTIIITGSFFIVADALNYLHTTPQNEI